MRAFRPLLVLSAGLLAGALCVPQTAWAATGARVRALPHSGTAATFTSARH